MRTEGAERERGRESARAREHIPSRIRTVSTEAWCRARSHKPRDHDLSRSPTLHWLSHPGAPKILMSHFGGSVKHLLQLRLWFHSSWVWVPHWVSSSPVLGEHKPHFGWALLLPLSLLLVGFSFSLCPSLTCALSQNKQKNSIPDEHRCKNPQQSY